MSHPAAAYRKSFGCDPRRIAALAYLVSGLQRAWCDFCNPTSPPEYMNKAGLFRLPQHGIEKVTQLLGCELVAFEIGDDLSLPVQDDGMESMCDEAFVLPGIHAELMTDFLDLEDWAS